MLFFPKNVICAFFFAAAPKVSQSQVHSGIAVSKPFPVAGGHPAPESGQTRLNVSVGCTSPPELRPFDAYGCFLLQGPSSLSLWASSSPLCCWWWSAAVSGSSGTSSRRPAHSQQRSPITSSTACICSRSGEGGDRDARPCCFCLLVSLFVCFLDSLVIFPPVSSFWFLLL